jgi:transposase
MEIMGINCAVVVTYNEALHKKQQYTLQAGIEKLKKKLQEKFASYKRLPPKLTKGITALKEADRYGAYIDIAVKDKKLVFTPLRDKMEAKEQFLGKNIIFSDKPDAESGWIIAQYKQKEKVEDDFKVLKSPDIIRFRPVRHWTDTKIYAYGFCCIMALILIKVMQIQADRIGLKMSPAVLKEELKDMKEIIMIYGKNRAEKQISQRSSIQQKLWELFDLMQVEKAVNHTLSA